MATDFAFEYPLSEKARVYLRLEFLFSKAHQLTASDAYFAHHAAFHALFELLETLDHGDIRSDLHSDLDKQVQQFKQLVNHPQVDSEKLQRFLQQLEKLYAWIVGHRGKFGASLRDNEFLQQAKQRFSLNGGSCPFDLPRLHSFLQRPALERRQKLQVWLAELQGIRTSVEVLLRLMREQAQWRNAQFDEGYFHLEPISGQLLRIRLEDPKLTYPEVSSGPKRCVLRLCRSEVEGAVQYLADSAGFQYALCG